MRKIARFLIVLAATMYSICIFSYVSSMYTSVAANTAPQLESGNLSVYIDGETLAIKLVDKRTGHIWRSDRDFDQDDANINNLWRNRITSGVTVEYFDAATKRSSYATVTGDECEITTHFEGDSFIVGIYFSNLEISLSIDYSLDGDVLVINIPNDSIAESDKLVKAIMLYPFLGSTDETARDGYIFVPDGSGAIMEYGVSDVEPSNPYKSKIFGRDEAVNDVFTSGFAPTIPIYGIADIANKSAFYVEASKGAAYAELYVYPVGVMLDYNWAMFSFNYRHSYFQPTGSDGSGYTDFQSEREEYDIELQYTFLSGDSADYVGMARDYQQTLVDRGVLSRRTNDNSFIHVAFLGSEIRKSLFWLSTTTYTSVDEAMDITGDILSEGITPTVSFIGYYNGGVSAAPVNKFSFEGKVGSKSDFERMIEEFKSQNVPLYFSSDISTINMSTSGYSKSRDLLRKIDQKTMSVDWRFMNYSVSFSLLNVLKISDIFTRSLPNLEKLGMNVAFSGISNNLYGDYGINMNREQAAAHLSETFAQGSTKTAYYNPNSYLWDSCDKYFQVPMSGTGFTIFTQSVPFLQIVLKGYVDYFSDYMNMSANPTRDTLRLIEYGAYPSYILTEHSSQPLNETPLLWIYSSQYSSWGDKLKETAKYVENALKHVTGARIESHSIASGVAVTTYDNGVKIVVNYNDNGIVFEGATVAGHDYTVIGVSGN